MTKLSDRNAAALLTSRPVLGTTEVLGASLAIGPIVSVGFGMFLLAGAAGAATPFVILIVAAGSSALGWCVSRYARRYAGAGAVYEYISRAHGRGMGIVASALFFLPVMIANGTALVTSLLWQSFARDELGFDPGWWSGGLISIALVSLLTYFGVRVSTRVLLALTVVSAIPFVITALAILAKGGESGHHFAVFGPGAASSGQILDGVLFGILLFIGFEAAACTGEEARLPHRSIPRAILLSIGVVAVFYLLMGYAATIGFGPNRVADEWGSAPTAFATLGDRYVGRPTSMLISLGIVVDALAVQMAVFNQFSRGYFALARDGLLPRKLAAVSRRNTPVGGLAAVVCSTVLVLVYAIAFDNKFEVFEIAATALTLTSLPTFLILALGSPRLVIGRRRRLLQVAVALVAAAVPALGLYGTFDPLPTGLRAVGAVVAGVMAAGVVIWFVLLRARQPPTVESAGSYALVAGAD